MEKLGLTSTTSTKSYKKERISLPGLPLDNEEKDNNNNKQKRGKSVVTKPDINQLTTSSNHSQQPLFVSVGDGLANFFGNSSEATQDQHLLTWTGDYV